MLGAPVLLAAGSATASAVVVALGVTILSLSVIGPWPAPLSSGRVPLIACSWVGALGVALGGWWQTLLLSFALGGVIGLLASEAALRRRRGGWAPGSHPIAKQFAREHHQALRKLTVGADDVLAGERLEELREVVDELMRAGGRQFICRQAIALLDARDELDAIDVRGVRQAAVVQALMTDGSYPVGTRPAFEVLRGFGGLPALLWTEGLCCPDQPGWPVHVQLRREGVLIVNTPPS